MTKLVAVLLLASPAMAWANNGLTLLPNSSGRSLMTPTAWGTYNQTFSIGLGATFPQAYTGDTSPTAAENQASSGRATAGDGRRDDSGTNDGAISITHGFGRPDLYGGLQLSATMNDVDDADLITFGFKVHRYFGFGINMAVGGENLLPTDNSDAEESFYFVISRASQRWADRENPDESRLHMSIGAGSGRFANKSPLDIANGKGENGTIVFANFALEVFKGFNLIAEWTGVNMTAGVSKSIGKSFPLTFTLGVADIFRGQSGDDPRILASLGFSHYYGK